MGKKHSTPAWSSNQLIEGLAQGLLKPQAAAPAIPEKPRFDPRYAIVKNQDFPEARWDVSGAFVYNSLLVRIHDFFSNIGILMISTVHDSPLCLWNSGRQKAGLHADQHVILQALKAYDLRRIPVHLTFSNSLLTSEYLNDPKGNILLNMISDFNQCGENGVIVCSDLLADHVKKNFPSLKLVSSVVKVAHEEGKGNLDYYRHLEKKYDKIMVHPDDNFNLDLLAQLENKDRYEILVNEPCIRNCPMRKRHYQVLSQISMNFLDSSLTTREGQLLQQNGCQNMADLLFNPDRRTLVLSCREIKQLYNLGFRNFKIQGRGMTNEHAMTNEIFRLALNHDPRYDYLTTRLIQSFYCGA
jgi:collagenase-like PrtC family protease